MKSIKVSGIKGAGGINISKIFLLTDDVIKLNLGTAENLDAEIAKVEKGIDDVEAKLTKQQERALEKQGKDTAEILSAHKQLLLDPIMKDDIIGMIKNEKIFASNATNQVMIKWKETFDLIEDEYMRARAADIVDVWTRVIKSILEIPELNLSEIDEEVIIVARDLTPSQTAQLDPKYVKGFVVEEGGATSHAALMAEAMKIPAILGVKGVSKMVNNNDKIIVHATSDETYVVLNPDEEIIKKTEKNIKELQIIIDESEKFRGEPSITKCGKRILLKANIGSVNDAVEAFAQDANGVGLLRSEFLYMENPKELPSEELQFQSYKKIVEAAKGKPVTVRTLDIGGDKKIDSLPIDAEMNPFLGYRAIRISLQREDIFKVQVRALLRASAFGEIKIMFPFISNVDEFRTAKEFVLNEMRKLKSESIKFDKNTKIGLMIEIPSTIWMSDVYNELADFVSVGTNDLVQYTFAVDRMNEKVAKIGNYFDPALFRSLKYLSENMTSTVLSMCGQMAGDPIALPILIGLDFTELSMSASQILIARRNLSFITKANAKALVEAIKDFSSAEQITTEVRKRFPQLKG